MAPGAYEQSATSMGGGEESTRGAQADRTNEKREAGGTTDPGTSADARGRWGKETS